MIGAMFFGAGRWLMGGQFGHVILIVTAVFLALTGWTWKVARDARAAVMERVLKETSEESSRRPAPRIKRGRAPAMMGRRAKALIVARYSKKLVRFAAASRAADCAAMKYWTPKP